ncbi:hypothetical protein C8Q79DRAFT_733174 [Trametes meyenii]|nr:hypothetical protein C8Q79DRAFT_733174 [Trametes meyenii]
MSESLQNYDPYVERAGLRSFVLSHIDTDAPLPPEPYRVTRNNKLEHLLALDACPVSDPEAVGKYVSALFPKVLRAVPDPQTGWDKVVEMVDAYHTARLGWRRL